MGVCSFGSMFVQESVKNVRSANFFIFLIINVRLSAEYQMGVMFNEHYVWAVVKLLSHKLTHIFGDEQEPTILVLDSFNQTMLRTRTKNVCSSSE